MEDVGLRVSARGRLLASVCSSVLAIQFFGVSIAHLGFPELDFILQNSVVAALFTIFALSGICHAFNIIDGLHGLCGFTSIIIGAALAQVAVTAGQPEMAQVIMVVIAAIAGFLALNYPRGLLFLGDSGAYVIGFALGCMAVHLMVYNAEVSPWALVLVFFWPIADTVLAFSRRVNGGSSALVADRMHFHQVMMRTLEICVLGKNRRSRANPLATLLLLPMVALPSVMGIILWNQSVPALAMTALNGIVFVLTYRACINLAQSRGKKISRKVRGKVIEGSLPAAEVAP
jgi:UDP-N-acetylmuramyl pentapeptide phosphotransferase/UDP-N-acetylglucosamine-1-phosphate transferase